MHTDFTLPLPSGSGSFFMSSNGLASGNHLLEAISHGLCEVVERDATTLWHLRTTAERYQTRLDLDTVEDPGCQEVLEKFARAGVDVAVWETTSDIGLPAFFCMTAEREPEPFRPLYPTTGAGCHPAREVALSRALTEAAQVRATLISGSRDDLGVARYYETLQDPVLWRRVHTVMHSSEPVRRFQEVPSFEGDSFEEDVAWELERLAAAGLEQVVVVDLTKPAFGIPVARVVIPGLESIHDAPGYVPGARARRLQEEQPSMIYVFAGPTLSAGEGRAELRRGVPPARGPGRRVPGRARAPPRPLASSMATSSASPPCGTRSSSGPCPRASTSTGAPAWGPYAPRSWPRSACAASAPPSRRSCMANLEDDDEVAVVHAPEDEGFRPLSEAMVNIRATLTGAERAGVIRLATRNALERLAKGLHYPERSYPALLARAAREEVPAAELERLRAWLPQGRVNQKREDALAMLRTMREELASHPGPKQVSWWLSPDRCLGGSPPAV